MTVEDTIWPPTGLAASRASTRSALRAAALRADEVHAAALEHRRATLENRLEVLGLDVSFEVLAAEREGRSKFAILVHESSWLDWSEHEAAIVETVQAHNQTLDNYLILPIRDGYRLEAVGIQIIATPMPALDVGDWAADVPPAFVSEVQTLVKQCDESLLLLSGLTELSEEQLEHGEVTDLFDAANNELSLAFDVLNSVDDEFSRFAVDRIREIAQRIEDESDAGFVGETYASAVYRGILGEPTDEAQLVGAGTLVAAEWMIDPEGTATRLDF
jgi:hypothetical protein